MRAACFNPKVVWTVEHKHPGGSLGSRTYVLGGTRAAIQAVAPSGAGSICQWAGLETAGLPVTWTAVLPAY